MERHGSTADGAFAMLVNASGGPTANLRDIAVAIVKQTPRRT